MKKRIVVLLLAVSTALCMIGCGGNSDNDSGKEVTATQNDGADQDNNSLNEETNDVESSSDKAYATYDDFTAWDRIPMTEIHFNYPHWGEEDMYDGKVLSRETNDFDIIMAYNVETPYTGELENILEQTYPEFQEIMREEATMNLDVKYTEILTTEKVTFENGIEAMKFEGVQPGYSEDWGPYPVFGYSFIYENVNITMGYMLDEDTQELRDEYEEELQDVVYRIITTLRIGEE